MHDSFLEPGVGLFESPTLVQSVTDSTSEVPQEWWKEFLYDQYDWNDPEFLERNRGEFGYYPLKLTRGFFTMVPVCCLDQITRFPDGSPKTWCAKIQYDDHGEIARVYAGRRGRVNEPETVMMHRELVGALHLPKLVVDHVNRRGLDNRGHEGSSVNLRMVSRSVNATNSVRQRTRNPGLPPGVEAYHGRFRGMRSYRDETGKPHTLRSEEVWDTPEPAHLWYLAQIAQEFGQDMWIHNPSTVNEPFFPNRKEGYDIELEACALTPKKTLRDSKTGRFYRELQFT